MLPDKLAALVEQDDVSQILEVGAERLILDPAFWSKFGVHYQHWPELKENLRQRFDLIIVQYASLPPNPPPLEQLGLIRNQLTSRIWLRVPTYQDGFAEHYLALGFIREKTSNNPQFLNYSYNLDSYNKTREWNNSQFWANPDQWHKRF